MQRFIYIKINVIEDYHSQQNKPFIIILFQSYITRKQILLYYYMHILA